MTFPLTRSRSRARFFGVPFSPASLFANGEQGAWYDPSDFGPTGSSGVGTLFQDAAGTTPVTAVEQAVGLMLDKSKGLVLGPELVTNGDFSGGTLTGWYVGASVTASVVSGEAQVTFAGALSSTADNWFSAGPMVSTGNTQTFYVEFDATWVSGAGSLQAGIGYNTRLVIAPNTGKTRYRITANSLRGGFGDATVSSAVVFGATASATVWRIDNVSVKLLPGNHAYQSTGTSRPILRARYNLLTYSEEFDQGVWTKTRTNVTPNADTAPNGTLTGDKLSEDSSSGSHTIFQSFGTASATTSYTFSVYLKNDGARYVVLALYEGSTGTHIFAGQYDLQTGTITGYAKSGGNTPTGTITAVGNGWYYCTLTCTTTTGGASAQGQVWLNRTGTFPANPYSYTGYTGDGTSGAFIWGAQLLTAADVTATGNVYQRVAAATSYDTSNAVWRPYLAEDGSDDSLLTNSIDFATVTSDGQARRNLLLNPTQFDDAYWTKVNATVTANATTAPDGSSTADKFVEAATNSVHTITVSPGGLSGTNTLSVYAKASERSWVVVRFDGLNAWFDLTNGVIGTVDGGITAAISNAGSGWWRCSVTRAGISPGAGATFRLSTGNNVDTYLGDGTSGLFLWGAQLETGSTATAFQNIGTDKMTVFAGVTKLSDAARGIVVELSATAASNNGAFNLNAPYAAADNYAFASRGTNTVDPTATGYAAPVTNVLTGIGDIGAPVATLRINGAQAATSAVSQGTGNFGNYPLYIGRRNNATLPFNGRIYSLIVRGAQSTAAEISATEAWVNQRTGAY